MSNLPLLGIMFVTAISLCLDLHLLILLRCGFREINHFSKSFLINLQISCCRATGEGSVDEVGIEAFDKLDTKRTDRSDTQ